LELGFWTTLLDNSAPCSGDGHCSSGWILLGGLDLGILCWAKSRTPLGSLATF